MSKHDQLSLPVQQFLADLAESQGHLRPEEVQFIPIGKVEWGFEFPRLHGELTEQLWNLEETEVSATQYQKTLRSLLKQEPELFDAANDLANFYFENEKHDQAQKIYERYVELAKSYIPPKFVQGKHHIIWAYMDNRPFLRLLAGYAQFIEATTKVSRAIPLYEEILAFNPNDNQGIRAILATAYLKTNKLVEVSELAAHYADEILPELVMGNVLALFKLGKISEAKKFLECNLEYQRHVIKEILSENHSIPATLCEGTVTVGGEDEAYYYWDAQGSLWDAAHGAKDFLRQHS